MYIANGNSMIGLYVYIRTNLLLSDELDDSLNYKPRKSEILYQRN